MTIEKTPNLSFKIIGLIASVFIVLAGFVTAVSWISISMTNNSSSIQALQQGYSRHETLISDNAKIIGQHAQLLSILDQHDSRMNVFSEFMTKGGRFTEQDGKDLHAELSLVQNRLQHYEILETELSWIKKSIANLERDLISNFNKLSNQIDKLTQKDKRYVD